MSEANLQTSKVNGENLQTSKANGENLRTSGARRKMMERKARQWSLYRTLVSFPILVHPPGLRLSVSVSIYLPARSSTCLPVHLLNAYPPDRWSDWSRIRSSVCFHFPVTALYLYLSGMMLKLQHRVKDLERERNQLLADLEGAQGRPRSVSQFSGTPPPPCFIS